ncbi:uncharacterized protein TNCV_5105181 [Trichonephila clavipes]|nr:uncharacterized protein TNCV_5105181 [Trichonephila clavipes]
MWPVSSRNLRNHTSTKTSQIVTEAYGDETVSCIVFEWYKRFSGRRVSVEDDEPVDHSSYAMDLVILNHGPVTWTTHELAPPLLTTPHQREDVSALDRISMHLYPTRRVFSGTGLELMTCQPRSDTLTTRLPWPLTVGWTSDQRKKTRVSESSFHHPTSSFTNSSSDSSLV